MRRLAAALALLAALFAARGAAAQEHDVEALMSFELRTGATVTRQVAEVEGCRVTIASAASVGALPPRFRSRLRLWLGDWILGDVGPHERGPSLARIVMVLRLPPAPHEIALHDSALAVLEDHLAAVRASALPYEEFADEGNRLAREIAGRGIAGEFGALAARNHFETFDVRAGAPGIYRWAPASAAALEVPADRAADAMVALATLQATACR